VRGSSFPERNGPSSLTIKILPLTLRPSETRRRRRRRRRSGMSCSSCGAFRRVFETRDPAALEMREPLRKELGGFQGCSVRVGF